MDRNEVKKAVRERDKNKCKLCGRKDSGNGDKSHDVHRIIPGIQYLTGFCVTLCRGCHSYMPKKAGDLFDTTYKGVYGMMIPRTSEKAEKLIANIRKLVADAESDGEPIMLVFGINAHEDRTGKPPRRLLRREHYS